MNTDQFVPMEKGKIQIVPRKIFGIRTAAIVETLGFLVLLTLYNIFFEDGKRYINTAMHPFTIIIILVSVQYGTLEGMFATIMATLFLYFGNIPVQKVGETLFDYQYRIVLLPMIWFILAFVIGELRMRLEYENQRLYLELVEMRKRALVISQEFEMLKSTKDNLEAHLVTQSQTITKTYETLHHLETLSIAQIMLKISDVIASSLKVKKFSVFTKGDYGFEVISSNGWTPEDKYSLRIRPEHPLFREMVSNAKIVSIVNEDEEKILDKEGVIACPLIEKENGQIFGMFKIESIEFIELNSITLQTVATLGELIGLAYSNAIKYGNCLENSMYVEDTKILSPKMFDFHQHYLKTVSESFKLPLWKILIRSEGGRRFWVDQKKAILHSMERIGLALLPKTATTYLEGSRMAHFAVLLLGADESHTLLLANRFMKEVEEDSLLSELQLSFEVNSLCKE